MLQWYIHALADELCNHNIPEVFLRHCWELYFLVMSLRNTNKHFWRRCWGRFIIEITWTNILYLPLYNHFPLQANLGCFHCCCENRVVHDWFQLAGKLQRKSKSFLPKRQAASRCSVENFTDRKTSRTSATDLQDYGQQDSSRVRCSLCWQCGHRATGQHRGRGFRLEIQPHHDGAG